MEKGVGGPELGEVRRKMGRRGQGKSDLIDGAGVPRKVGGKKVEGGLGTDL